MLKPVEFDRLSSAVLVVLIAYGCGFCLKAESVLLGEGGTVGKLLPEGEVSATAMMMMCGYEQLTIAGRWRQAEMTYNFGLNDQYVEHEQTIC